MNSFILDSFFTQVWAMEENGLNTLQDLLESRLSNTFDVSKLPVETLHANSFYTDGLMMLENSKYSYVDTKEGIGILKFYGPVFPRANMMTQYSGAVSITNFGSEFEKMYNDPKIPGILIDIDSPGGDVRFVGETANMMYGLTKTKKKPVIAFTGGLMCSAAYYIGATADFIIASDIGTVGSIGVLMRGKTEQGVHTVRSSKSPKKALEFGTPESDASLQERIDDMAEIFIRDVAKFRNVGTETVENDFGQGDVLIGVKSKKAGLVDKIGTYKNAVDYIVRYTKEKK